MEAQTLSKKHVNWALKSNRCESVAEICAQLAEVTAILAQQAQQSGLGEDYIASHPVVKLMVYSLVRLTYLEPGGIKENPLAPQRGETLKQCCDLEEQFDRRASAEWLSTPLSDDPSHKSGFEIKLPPAPAVEFISRSGD